MIFRHKIVPILFFILSFFVTTHSYAHEVYVLDPASIALDATKPPLNLFQIALSNKYLFLVCVFIAVLSILAILGISLSRKVEQWVDPLLFKIKPYAGHIAQLTLGVALIASAYYGALFGTELPLPQLFGAYASLVRILLYGAGILVLTGVFVRVAGLIALGIYIAAWFVMGSYMISYLTYFAEALLLALFSGGYQLFSIPSVLPTTTLYQSLHKYKYFFLRVMFSMSLMYAAFYAKFIHGMLALDTVTQYGLTNYFPFDPLFVVLGAFLIEMMIALFYLIGFEIRFISLFFLSFLTLSLVFFGEAVWPHFILIGTALTLFAHGYDKLTIERSWYTEGEREPVL